MLNVKCDFPIFSRGNTPFVYLDSSSSSQKPKCVIEAVSHYYQNQHANVHRGVYRLSEQATESYENTRKNIQKFIQAKAAHEVIFTRGTTESINLVAHCFSKNHISPNDEVIVSAMEHHSNIVPWQSTGALLKVIPLLDSGELDLVAYETLFSKKTKCVAITHASNVLGTLNPLKKIIDIAHAQNVPVLVDGAQAFPHLKVDVQALDCDFYTFSAHKAYGPTGVGVLYGKTEYLEKMPPYQTGGSMIESVSFEKTTFAPLPYKFEAGTPSIASVVGMDAAIHYMQTIGLSHIEQHEQALLDYALKQLRPLKGLRILGPDHNKLGVVSFVLEGVHPHDIATVLAHEGICVRAGHHCAMPLMAYLGISACVRVSLGVYNTENDIDALVAGLTTVKKVFRL